jgi:hypothetical protein
MMNNAAELFALLRASTSEMLGFGTPTPVQQLKVDLAASLRMEIDRIVSQQLAGQAADVRALTALTESLRSLFPAAADSGHDFSGAKEELARFLADRAGRIEHRELKESERLRAENASLREENERLAAIRQMHLPNEQPVTPGISGSSITTQQQAPPPDNVIPIRDPELLRLSSRSPALKTPEREAELASNAKAFVSSYTTGSGAICAPPFNIDPRK